MWESTPTTLRVRPAGTAVPVMSANASEPADVLKALVDLGLTFKGQEQIYQQRLTPTQIRDLVVQDLPRGGCELHDLVAEFKRDLLPLCKNEASPQFLGFGDTGDDFGALAGAMLAMFTQQNLINQSFDSPSATFVEIAVLRWIRDLIGYCSPSVQDLDSVWDAGGVVTTGGTMSNTIAMMLAREHRHAGTMQSGVVDPKRCAVVVPKGIGHYSVRSSLTWIGCGNTVIEVDTDGLRYDLGALRRTLDEHRDVVMAVVAYAGDSRTQTIEHLDAVHDAVRATAPEAWLHADACWGFMATFSPRTRHLVAGIDRYDSVTVDPHKVMAVPYAVSALVTRETDALRSITSHSDLIMQEAFAFGQVTPFVGSKPWSSLKLWMSMRNHGREGLATMVEHRLATMHGFVTDIDSRERFVRLHEPELTACAFMWIPPGIDPDCPDIEWINSVNKQIHARLLAGGAWYLHQFSLPDPGVFEPGRLLHPLRFMSVNTKIRDYHVGAVLDEVDRLGLQVIHEATPDRNTDGEESQR